MSDILIRDIPEDVASALTEHARAAGKDRMTYIRDLLVKVASGPIIRERYALRFYNDNGDGRGLVRRFGDGANATSCTYSNVTEPESRLLKKVEDLVRRNEVGDREEATNILKGMFENVFEVA